MVEELFPAGISNSAAASPTKGALVGMDTLRGLLTARDRALHCTCMRLQSLLAGIHLFPISLG